MVYGFLQKETEPLVLLEILVVQALVSSAQCCFPSSSWRALPIGDSSHSPPRASPGRRFRLCTVLVQGPPTLLKLYFFFFFCNCFYGWVHGIILTLATPVQGGRCSLVPQDCIQLNLRAQGEACVYTLGL